MSCDDCGRPDFRCLCGEATFNTIQERLDTIAELLRDLLAETRMKP